MILTEQQIEYIDTNLKFYGVASEELRNDVLDHMCSYIEENDFPDFETAYKEALQKFGGYAGVSSIQRETYLQVSFRKAIKRQKLLSFFCFASAMLFAIGFFFRLFHWKGAGVILGSSILLLIIVVLPLYFYQRYRNTENKLYNHNH